MVQGLWIILGEKKLTYSRRVNSDLRQSRFIYSVIQSKEKSSNLLCIIKLFSPLSMLLFS